MDENLLRYMPHLTKQDLRNITWVMECSDREVPLLNRQRTRTLLLEASKLFPGSYANTAGKLHCPSADQPD
jgi:hypothetical protein